MRQPGTASASTQSVLASISLRPSPCQNSLGIILHIQASRSFHGAPSSRPATVARPRVSQWTVSIPMPAMPVQVRRQSTTPPGDDAAEKGIPQRRGPQTQKTEVQRVPIFPLMLRIIRGSLRSLVMPFKGQTMKGLYKSNPEELVIALIVLAASALVVMYVVYIYFDYFYSRQFTRYPPTVAKWLRRALYFSRYSPDPKRALQNYKLALEECDRLRLDPFSDDVLGIRIQLASWLESVQNYDGAIKVLELLLEDCKKWVSLMEKTVKEAGPELLKAGDDAALTARLPRPLVNGWLGTKREATPANEENPVEDMETIWGRRSRIMRKSIGISMKLGELYSDEHVLKADLAHERLEWAVETALTEFRRRSTEGVKKNEGEWMTPKEMGASLESLGQSYESKQQFHLALPLFFQALRLCDEPCHSAVIMNNLAATFAQHPVAPPYETLIGPVIPKLPSGELPVYEDARKAYLETAQRWAVNANQHAGDVKGDARTPECDSACAVSLCNLGDIAILLGKPDEARKRFTMARAMSEKLGYAPGVKQADAGLGKLSAA